MAESYRYRVELPRVVEAVHRKNALIALGARGIRLAQDAPWQTIYEAGGLTEGEYRIASTQYAGAQGIDGLFGVRDFRLHASDSTPYGQVLARTTGDFENLRTHTKISLFKSSPSDWTEVFMTPDAPPFAVRIFRLPAEIGYQLDRVSDAEVLEMTQRARGSAFEFISEDAAQNIIQAVKNDGSAPMFG